MGETRGAVVMVSLVRMGAEASTPDAGHDFPVEDPFRWCVRSPILKTVLVVMVGVLADAAARTLTAWTGSVWADQITLWVLWCAGAYLLTRIFRASDESNLPRPWWKMTGHPTASFMIGLLLLLGVLTGNGWYFARPLPEQLILLLPTALAVLYLHSSYRMGRFRIGAPSGTR